MTLTHWLESDIFDWIAAGLAISLLVGSFLIVTTTIFTRRKRSD